MGPPYQCSSGGCAKYVGVKLIFDAAYVLKLEPARILEGNILDSIRLALS